MADMDLTVTYPDVRVQLTRCDGNVFQIIGSVVVALKRAGHPEAAKQFADDATDCESYDAVLRLAMSTVAVA